MVQLTLILMIGDDERWVVDEVDDPCFFWCYPCFFDIFWCGFPCFLLPVLSVVLSTFSWFDPFQSSTFPRLVPSPATSNYLFPAVGSSMFFPYFFWMLHHFISFPFINMSKIISSNFQLLDILKMLPFFQSGITCGKTQTHVAKKKGIHPASKPSV